jgi:hypothetical protein
MAKKDGNKVTVKRPLTDHDNKRFMMAVLIRNEQAFKAVAPDLTPENFGHYDAMYAVLWKAVLSLHQEFGVLPDDTMLGTEIRNILTASPGELTDPEIEQLEEFLDFAYDDESFRKPIEECDEYVAWAIKVTKLYLEEQLSREISELTSTANSSAPAELPSLLAKHQQQSERIASITHYETELAFPEGWDKEAAIEVSSTGLAFIDKFMGGGHAPGEVYGLMGPYGSCKTTLSVMMAAEACDKACEKMKEPDWNGKKPLVFFFSYEAPKKELRNRILSYKAKILRKTVDSLDAVKGLSELNKDPNNLRDYEQRLFADKIARGEPVMCEYERAQKIIPLLNDHLLWMDMTGADPVNRGAGTDYVAEISRRISAELRRRPGTCCGLVIVDYVGAMVRRHMAAHDKDENALRHLIGGAPIQFKTEVALAFDCPVWLIHQFSGAANAKGVGAKMHHTDSAEAKNFGENLDFAYCLGNLDGESRGLLWCTKTRRADRKDNNSVIKVDGALSRVLCQDLHFGLDPYTNEIKPKHEIENSPGGQHGAASSFHDEDDEEESPDPGSNNVNIGVVGDVDG